MAADGYELIDAGDGRRLERFGERVADRPAPGAIEPRHEPASWPDTDLRFDRAGGWTGASAAVEPWTIPFEGLTFELRPTDAGQVGLFPEQATNWRWMRERLVERGDDRQAATVLHLFAYTGGATLMAAAAGASVIHVDAARSAIGWAKRNAELSGVAGRPIRWIVDDAEAFVRREARRGHRYAGIVLDPPSYGHGKGGRTWRLDDRLDELLASCREVATDDAFVVLTAHTEGIDGAALGERLGRAFGPNRPIETLELRLTATSGASLWLGSCARMMQP